ARVEDPPKLRTLVLWVPGMLCVAMRENALLSAGLLFIAARAADGGVELAGVERLAQGLRLHDVGEPRRPLVEGVDIVGQPLGVGVRDELKTVLNGHSIAKRDHLLELPGRVDVEQRERD